MKTMMIIAAAFSVSIAVAQQQNDQTTVNTNPVTPQPSTTTTPQPPATNIQQSPVGQPAQQYQYRVEDRVTVPNTNLPDALKQTLQGDQYKGWENSTIYQDRATGNYYYQTNSGIPPTGGGNTNPVGGNVPGNTTVTPSTNGTSTTVTPGTTGLSTSVPGTQNSYVSPNTVNPTNTMRTYSFDRNGSPLNNTGSTTTPGLKQNDQ